MAEENSYAKEVVMSDTERARFATDVEELFMTLAGEPSEIEDAAPTEPEVATPEAQEEKK